MAKPTPDLWIGIDVGKAELVVDDGHTVAPLPNRTAAIRAWLERLPGRACIAVEATGTFYRQVLGLAHAAGHRLFVIDGLRLNRYRDSIGGRAKTDRTDAQLLRRYLMREHHDLRPWTPPPAGYESVQRLLRRRAKLVKARTQLRQSLADLPELHGATRDLIGKLGRLIAQLERLLQQAARQASLPVQTLTQVEGLGPLTATALANSYQRGPFSRSDAFIAFLGLDVRVRDSGRCRGRRKLTKQGDPELRRLLYNAAMAASRSERWKPVYQRHLDRGLSRIQSLVVLARKLARIAFALLKSGDCYRPRPSGERCLAT